ncbi:HNH endonuclease signature motif containing protein [Halobacteriovorax sp. XZX-3]|uniref:HNH endonuclease signature motif containing protein n=1 Tax=unclassified Halobacteriovorax TaxID=2639665 RepID=UPI00371F780D
MLDIFEKEVIVSYRNETYNVRDNGAIFRYKKEGRKKRRYDCIWMFGNESRSHPYLTIASERVHRIVATAFHGVPPQDDYIVDHIDTNCRNNRPENLRWITRLENALLNPITKKRIEYHCGSIEEFLKDPTLIRNLATDKNFSWMKTVTKEEAQNSLERMMIWANENNSTPEVKSQNSIGKWLYGSLQSSKVVDVVKSLTPHCYQLNWRTPSQFPSCPIPLGDDPLRDYYISLEVGKIFSKNKYCNGAKVVEFTYVEDKKEIVVLTERDGMKPWALGKVEYQDSKFIHSNLGSFFTLEGAKKQFCIVQGLAWEGEDSIDDYC